MGQLASPTMLEGAKTETITLEDNLELFWTPYDPAAPLLDKHSKEILTHVHNEICTRMFTAVLSITIKTRNNSNDHQQQNGVYLVHSYDTQQN